VSVNFTHNLNNPGHIEIGAPWEGLAPTQRHGRFAAFVSPEYGIRAIARVLITYQDKRLAKDGSRIDTVAEIIERWAPSSENDASSYAAHVRKRLGLSAGDTVDVKNYETMRGLVTSIILHENGSMPYSDEEIRKGIALAGIAPPVKPVKESRTLKAGTVAAGATGVGMMAEAAQQIAPAVPLVETIGKYAPWAVGVLVIAAVGYMAYRYLQDRKLRVA